MRALPSALALVAALLAPLALAQVPAAQPAVSIQLSATEARVGAGNETTLVANVVNGGSLAASVSIDLGLLEKWDVRAEPRTFPLPAGASQPVQIVLRAPAAGQGAASGVLAVRATLTEANTGRTAQGQASLALARVDPPPPLPPSPWPLDRVAPALGGSLLVIGAVVLAESRRRRALRVARNVEAARWQDRELGILIEPEGPLLPWGLRRETLQRVAVRNVTPRPRVAHVGVRRAPPGWTAALSLPRLALEPGERAVLTLYLNPSPDVPGGAPAEVVLFARTAEAQEHEEIARIAFQAPPVRIPQGDETATVALRR